jgi:hypothetical protein
MTKFNTDTVGGGIPVLVNRVAAEGQKILPIPLDFSVSNNIDFDFTNMYERKQFTLLQTIYFDNSANDHAATITVAATGQTINIPIGVCGYFTFLEGKGAPKFNLTTAGTTKAFMALMNFYVPANVWK